MWGRVEGVRDLIEDARGQPITDVQWKELRNWLKGAMNDLPETSNPPPLELCRNYLAIAKEDAAVSRLLYNEGRTAPALYHIQQGIEKTTKAFCLAAGIATPESLTDTHRTPQPLLSAMGKKYFGAGLLRTLDKDCRKKLRRANHLVNHRQDILARLPFLSTGRELGIRELLDALDSLSRHQELLEEKEQRVKTIMAGCLPEHEADILGFAAVKFGQVGPACLVLGALTYPHESSTRYPGGDLEPHHYEGDLGIVQAIPSLLERTPLTIRRVEELVDHIEQRGRTSKDAER